MLAIRRLQAVLLTVFFVLAGVSAASAAPRIPSIKPPAPVSNYISQTDEGHLRAVFEALEKRNYALANISRSRIEAPVARSLADWAYLRSGADGISPREIGRFLDSNYGWPSESLLQEKAEEAFTDNTPTEEVFTFFQNRDPITSEGHLRLADAFLAIGNTEAAVGQIRRAWIDFNHVSRDERLILQKYGAFLGPQDHWEKADRQLFDIRATATKRLLPYLPSDRRRQAETRIAFLTLDRNAAALYSALPADSQQDAGVLLAAVRYYRRTDRDDQAITYAGLAPLDAETLRDPGAWFYERKLLARWALKNARFEDTYLLSAYSGLDEGADFAEAEFMAGWVALRFLNDPERAKAHFAYLGTGVSSPISRSRGEYWLGRAFAATGDDVSANQHYRVAAAFPYTFYGQLAIHELGENAPAIVFPQQPEEPDAASLTVFEARPLVHAMHILAEVGEDLHFNRFARALDDQLQSEGEVMAYYDLVIGERKTFLAVRAGKVARNNGVDVPEVIYPLYLVPDAAARYVEKPLILGLSRQESEFNPRAYSRARARGMMQLLASTAQITARKEGLPYSTSRLLDDPSYNMTLGAAHLSHLLDRFSGSYIMVMGAYNAGSGRVDQWIETYGDPRDPSVDPIDWIEMIPFSETRNYVMRVTENTQVYRSRLEGQPLGAGILADITRGGGSRDAIGITPPSPRLMVQASLADPEPTFGRSILNFPDRKTRAQEIFEGLTFEPLHTDGIAAGESDLEPEADRDAEIIGDVGGE